MAENLAWLTQKAEESKKVAPPPPPNFSGKIFNIPQVAQFLEDPSKGGRCNIYNLNLILFNVMMSLQKPCGFSHMHHLGQTIFVFFSFCSPLNKEAYNLLTF